MLRAGVAHGVGVRDRRLPGGREMAQGPPRAQPEPGRGAHLLRILTALARTIEVQADIDDLYLAVEAKPATVEWA